MSTARRVLGVGTIGALVVAGLVLSPAAARPDPASPESAHARLQADADGRVVTRAEGGALRFAGVRGTGDIDNPAVRPGTSAAAAADAHLVRYGAAFGATVPGTTLDRTAVDGDIVRYQQLVDGLPVLGGELAVSLRADRSLGSILANLSTARPAAGTPISEDAAEDAAVAQAAKVFGTSRSRVTTTSAGRWLYDPAVAGTSLPTARSVWRFEVTGAPFQHHLVLVDDRTGGVLLDSDLVANIDRVVCDAANVAGAGRPCTSGFARVEGGPTSPVDQVNSAYDLMGAASDFYSATFDLDLTQLLGTEVNGVKKLAATVRFCLNADRCPYQNAHAATEGLLFGDGWAAADDITAHELTHGVIARSSDLLYWGQSGAVNESLADVMGEVVDHQHPSPGDSPDDWRAGEDSPSARCATWRTRPSTASRTG